MWYLRPRRVPARLITKYTTADRRTRNARACHYGEYTVEHINIVDILTISTTIIDQRHLTAIFKLLLTLSNQYKLYLKHENNNLSK